MGLIWHKLRTYAELVRIEHTVFALPFAYVGAFLASGGWPRGDHFLWITAAMVGARTAAMALNRLIDWRMDARNPRTAGRHLPSGRVQAKEVLALSLVSLALLSWAAWNLNALCVALLPLVILNLVIYSYTKRFTWLCHFVLGLALGWAPFGGYIAVTGAVSAVPLLLMAAVTLWTAGFDILYATQDLDFDRRHNVFSIPARFGIAAALLTARLLHLAVVLLVAAVGLLAQLGWLYWAGALGVAALLHYEHSIISPRDLSRLNAAFFNINGYVSILYFLFTAAATVAG